MKNEIQKHTVIDIYPLTPMQEGMLFHYLQSQGRESLSYLGQSTIHLEGSPDVARFRQTFKKLVERHDALRTAFVYKNVSKPKQVVLQSREAELEYLDVSDYPQAEKERQIESHCRGVVTDKFDLTNDVLLRMSLIRVERDQYRLVITNHHIILDGWGQSNLLNDMIEIYRCLKEGHDNNPTQLYPFGRYVKWLSRQDREAGKDYFSDYLAGYKRLASIAPRNDLKRGAAAENGSHQVNLSETLTRRLEQIAETNGVTLNTLVQTSWSLLLQKYTGARDLVYGVVVSGRPPELPGAEAMVGNLINTIPFRTRVNDCQTLEEVLRGIHENFQAVTRYSYLALTDIQALVKNRCVLFDHILVFENYPLDSAAIERQCQDLDFTVVGGNGWDERNYDLDILIKPGSELKVQFEYNRNIYNPALIETIGAALVGISEQLAENPAMAVADVTVPAAAGLEFLTAAGDRVYHRGVNISLAEIKDCAGISGDWLNHVYVFENYPQGDFESEQGPDTGFKITALEGKEQVNYDFNILIIPGNETCIRFSYNTNAIDEKSVKRISGHIRRAIAQVLEDPGRALSSIDLLTNAEKSLLHAVNDTGKTYLPPSLPAGEITLQRLFEQRAGETPEQTAVIYGGKVDTGAPPRDGLTYRELNQRANRLAAHLTNKGAGPDQVIGIMVERSIEMVVGILAILKAGGAYLPIDPTLPVERIGYMLQDSGCKLLLTRKTHSNITFDGEMLELEDDAIYSGDGENPPAVSGKNNLAYVIFTSGSAGNPKGVMVEHEAVINRLLWMADNYNIDRRDVILQKTVFTFDVSVWELFLPLITGAKMVLLKQGDEKNPVRILDAITGNEVTALHFVPSMLSAFLQFFAMPLLCPRLRFCFCSGEALKPAHKKWFFRVFPDVELHNLYGPTEAAIDVSHYRVEKQDDSIPIGRPVANTRLYILDNSLQPVPLGVAGELYIGGIQLARGYLNRADLTARKFIDNPFGSGRLYSTGDLARWREDTNIEYLGRIDNQVKVRGYRIELGEIETRLQAFPGINEVVVSATEDTLNAYIVADKQVQPAALREWLKRQLPNYMIPSHFVPIEAIPLTSSGKVDRKKLPNPDAKKSATNTYTAPGSALEAVYFDYSRHDRGDR